MQVDTNVSEADVGGFGRHEGQLRGGRLSREALRRDGAPGARRRSDGAERVTYDAVIDVDNPMMEEPQNGILAGRRPEGANPKLEGSSSGIPRAGDRGAPIRAPAQARHDGQRHLRLRGSRRRVAHPQLGAPLPPDAEALAVVKAKADPGAARARAAAAMGKARRGSEPAGGGPARSPRPSPASG